MSRCWPDEVDGIVAGDHLVMLAYATPANGVVLLPLSNFGIRDAGKATITVNSSVGVWRKLVRMRRNPNVALAFHTRTHADHERPEYVLAQGRAELSEPIPDYPSTVIEHWRRFEPWDETGRLWRWWQRVYALRVEIVVHVERVVVWPDLRCAGPAQVHGFPLPAGPPPGQRPPKGGTRPRIDHARAARGATRLPETLLGWVGADGRPVAVPAEVAGTDERGFVLRAAAGLVPLGGRRAGLTAHGFSSQVIGQRQRKHTGWLEAGPGGRLAYAPHTLAAYRFPRSRLLYRLVSGYGTRRGLAGARRAGFVP